MLQFVYQKSIQRVNLLSIIFAGILTLVFTLMIIYNGYGELNHELTRIQKEYVTTQRNFIKNETTKALEFIKVKYKHFIKAYPHPTKDEIEEFTNLMISELESFMDKSNKDYYLFIYTFDGINVFDPNKSYNRGKNLYFQKDINGVQVIKELINISKKNGGGYVEYNWEKPSTKQLAPKVSYAISFFPLDWMIGSGVYFDSIKDVLNEKKLQHKRKVIKFTLEVTVLAFLLFLVAVFGYKYFAAIISKDIDYIRNQLQSQHFQYKYISINNLFFSEFQKISTYINEMIAQIKEKTHSLQELNKNLENKVQERTKTLDELVVAQDKFIKNSLHEINTPLSSIIINIDLLKSQNLYNQNLQNIESSAKTIHNIYNDLSYMLKKDRVVYHKSPINFSEFLKKQINFFHTIAEVNGHIFVTTIANDIVIEFNDTQLQRVIDNNISNAIKYSFAKEPIFIKLLTKEGRVVFEVTTKSDEIKNELLIFTDFYRENDVKGGFGLGLKIVHEICEENGVEIVLQREDGFTRFQYLFGVI